MKNHTLILVLLLCLSACGGQTRTSSTDQTESTTSPPPQKRVEEKKTNYPVIRFGLTVEERKKAFKEGNHCTLEAGERHEEKYGLKYTEASMQWEEKEAERLEGLVCEKYKITQDQLDSIYEEGFLSGWANGQD